MKKRTMILLVIGSFLATLGCNGKKKTTTPGGGDNDPSRDVSVIGGTTRPRPKVLSVKAVKAFKKVEQDVKAIIEEAKSRGGKWTTSDCRRVAKAFERVARDTAGERNAVARARFNEGVAWAKCRDDDRAKIAYQAALSANHNYAPAKVNLAELAARGGNPAAAYQTFLQAFLSAPENLDANYNLAVIFEQKARRGEPAPEVLTNFWRKLKFEAKDCFDLAEAHLRMVLAKSSAGKTVRDATLNLKAYSLLSLLYFQQSKQRKHRSKLMLARLVLKEASKVYKKSMIAGKYCKTPETPTDFDLAAAQLRNLTGLILLRQQRLVEAMYRFEATLNCDANNVEAHMNRAAIALGFRGYRIAFDSFTRVLKQQPKNLDAVIGLGVAYRGLASLLPGPRQDEMYKKAVAQYKKALSLNPNATDAIYNLGHLYMDYLNDINKAERWYKEYLNKPRQFTSKAARKSATDQIAEIAYQRIVIERMKNMKSKMEENRIKMEELRKQREADEAARRAAAMRPMARDMARPMRARPKAMGAMKGM